MEEVAIDTENINLDQFLKWAGIIESGGQAKLLLDDEIIKLNGNIVKERRKKLKPGDIVEIEGMGKWKVIETQR
jgi:ribosome-associated protein